MGRTARITGIALTLATAVAGCGPPPRNRTETPASAVGPVADAPYVPANERDAIIAREARDATLGRQGNWRLTSERVQEVAPLVRKASLEYGIPEDLVFGIIWVESRFNPQAVSPVGARGLMQIMPATADYLAELMKWKGNHDSFDPEFNIAAGTYYIARLIDQFGGDVNKALAAYNAGPTKVRRWLAADGLPRVSIEYHTMVQTARGFFGGGDGGTWRAPSTEDLDRLGLAILIAGLSGREFGLERENETGPLN